MNVADWVIVVVVLVAAVHAASEGFFHEAFGIAGLILGYLLAAWQYWRVARTFAPYVNSPWLADILHNGAVRGIISGLGLLDIWIGISEAVHYRDYRG